MEMTSDDALQELERYFYETYVDLTDKDVRPLSAAVIAYAQQAIRERDELTDMLAEQSKELDIYKQGFNRCLTELAAVQQERDAAVKELHSVIDTVDDPCSTCKHHIECKGKECDCYESGKGAVNMKTGRYNKNLRWECMDWDFATCKKMEDTPCAECGGMGSHWQWRGVEEKE